MKRINAFMGRFWWVIPIVMLALFYQWYKVWRFGTGILSDSSVSN